MFLKILWRSFLGLVALVVIVIVANLSIWAAPPEGEAKLLAPGAVQTNDVQPLLPLLQAELTRLLGARELRTRVARRGLPRRLRHFQRAPKIEFGDRDGATQLALVCSDRPGLLAEVAQVLHEARVRVHDARIATFGERVEDFFVLTDRSGAVLDDSTRDALRTALQQRLGATAPRTSE